MSDVFKQLKDKQAALEKAQAEEAELKKKVADVIAQVHKQLGDLLLEKSTTDASAKHLLKEFLAVVSKTKDKHTKGYLQQLHSQLSARTEPSNTEGADRPDVE